MASSPEGGGATTTISTIAVQSGGTRIVIALLQSKAWIELKIQEMQPAMTDVGDSLAEATELYQQHEKVLEKLQTKQSPVEELLRQADDLISTQKPRGEVYSAMAENLGLAWKDLNAQLDQRRHILEQAVAYFTRAQQFVDSLEVIKRSVADLFLPETVESAATMLLRHNEERKMTLSGSMRLLCESQLLQERLCEVATHSMGDSRPLHMAPAARRTAACVERRTGELQDRWRLLEALWAQKRARLDQCLLKCQLNDQIAEIQDWIRTKCELSQHNLGDSSASAEILQHEHVKIENECKDKQEQCLRLVKTAEGLGQSGHYAAEELRSNAYLLLSECSDLYSHLETRRHLLAESISFFNKAQSALNKLDQIEIQVSTSDVQHANLATTAEDIANAAIRDGRQILDITGSHELGAQGVLRKVEELERKRGLVAELCRANESLAVEKTLAFRKFCDACEELLKWLTQNGHAFTQRTRDMGATTAAARTFVDQHDALQNDLRMKGVQVEALLRTAPTLVHSGGVEAQEVHQMADDLRGRFTAFRGLLDSRLLLAQRYLQFLKLAARVAKETDELEQLVQGVVQGASQGAAAARGIEERQLSLRQEILQATNSGRNFLEDARKVDDPHLNVAQACATVEEILSGLETRSVTLNTQWLNYQNQISATRDTLIQWEHLVKESHRVIKCAKELEGKMFPVIPKELNRVESILPFLENRMSLLLPQIKSVQKEMESFLKKSETLNLKEDPEGQRMLRELRDMNHGFQKKLTDYQILVSMMTAFFKNFEELEKLVSLQESQFGVAALPTDPARLQALLQEDHAPTVLELFRFSGTEAQQLTIKIDEAEPPAEAAQDREKICSILADRKRAFEAAWAQFRIRLEQHQQLCTFNRDMQMINQQIEDLRTQLSLMSESYGDSLPSAVHTSEAFVQFEKTIELLQLRIQQFASTAEGLVRDQGRVQQETRTLQRKWSTFRTQVTRNRRLIDVALEYYRTVEETEEWLKEGSRLLISVARQSSGSRGGAEADALRGFLDRGRERQEERLTKIASLSLQLHGDRPQQTTQVVTSKHRDLLESFSVISAELATLTATAKAPEEQPKLEEVAARTPPAALRPPRFLRPLMDAEVAEGGRHAFECQVEGDPVPQVQWFKDGILVENNPDYQTTFEAGLCRLTIEETFSEDTARFSCKATNPAGYAETYCQLLVKESRSQSELSPPQFVQRPADAAVAEGRPLQLECQVSGNPLPLVTWFRDDACIDYCTDYAITYNNGLCRLRVEEAAPEHRGTYVCRAANPAGQAECSARLQVCSTVPSEKPSFVVPLSNVMARAGQKLRLECAVTGQPEPEVTWLHNSKPIKETRDTKMHFDGRNATLIITEAFPKDAGAYAAVGRNRAGEGLSSCTVSVKGRLPLETSDSEMASDIEPAKPQVKLHLEDQTVCEGNKVRMDCVIVGQPEPEVIWYHNGKPVKESDDFQLLFEGDRCTLVIKTAYLEDAGAYKCVAINSGGEASSLCHLAIQPVKEVEPRSQSSKKDILITVEKPEPPKFLKLLESVAVPENAPLLLSCQVSAGATLTWFKDAQEITPGAEFQIETDASGASRLTAASAQGPHGGAYSAVAQNNAGRAQTFCTATVLAAPQAPGCPPRFLRHIEDQRPTSGGSARFETVVTGVPLPQVRWNFQGQCVAESENCETGRDGETHWLALRGVALAHVGRYSAVAENDAGIATTSALLAIADRAAPPMDSGGQEQVAQSMVMMRKKTVVQTSRISSMSEVSDMEADPRPTYPRSQQQRAVPLSVARASPAASALPPRFLRPVSTAVVTEGEKLLLEAAYEGSPEPSVTWLKGEAELRTGPRLQVTSGGGRTSLFVPKSLVSDGGRYRCVAASASGRAASDAEVRVRPYREPPKYVKRLQAGVVRSGSRVSFDVQVSGVPPPEVTWYRNGSLLQNTPDFRISSSEGCHSLVIPEVFPDDSGNFMAVASNAAGEARSMADLVVEEDKSPEEDRGVSYQHFSSVEHKKEMFTKVSMSQSSHVEPYFLPQEIPKPLSLKKDPEPDQSPSPPPIPAVAAHVWSQPKPEPFPAPAITETQEPIQVPSPEPEEPVPLATSTALGQFQTPVPEAQVAPPLTCAAVSESFVRQSIMKFSKPDTKQQQQQIRAEDKKFRSFSQQVQQPVIYQNGVDKSKANSISTVTQSSFVSESRSVMTSGVARSEIFDVPRPAKFVPMHMMAPTLSEQFTTDVGVTPVWKPTGQELDYTPTWKTVQAPAPIAKFPEIPTSQSKASPVELIPSTPLKPLEVKPISIETCSVSSSEIKHVTSQEPTSISSSQMKPVCFQDSKQASAQILQMPEKTTTSSQTLFRTVEPPPPPPSEASVETHSSIEHSSQTLPELSKSSFSSTSKSTSTSSSQTPLPFSTTESVTKTRTSYSTEEISVTKKYEVVVEEQRTESSSTEVATQQPRTISEMIIKEETSDGPLIKTETFDSSTCIITEDTSCAPKSLIKDTSEVLKPILKKETPDAPRPILKKQTGEGPKPLIKKDTSDAPKPIIKKETSEVSGKPKKEVVIEEEPVVGAEVKPPQFSKLLQDVWAEEGAPASFECSVHGAPAPAVRWFKDRRQIAASEDHQIVCSRGACALRIPEAYPQDEGEYSCAANNNAGCRTTSAYLRVLPRPDGECTRATRYPIPRATRTKEFEN